MFEIDSNAVTMIERFGSQFRADGLSVTTPVRIFHACFCKIGSVSAWMHKGSIMQPTAKDGNSNISRGPIPGSRPAQEMFRLDLAVCTFSIIVGFPFVIGRVLRLMMARHGWAFCDAYESTRPGAIVTQRYNNLNTPGRF
jgi:hypothetical protein